MPSTPNSAGSTMPTTMPSAVITRSSHPTTIKSLVAAYVYTEKSSLQAVSSTLKQHSSNFACTAVPSAQIEERATEGQTQHETKRRRRRYAPGKVLRADHCFELLRLEGATETCRCVAGLRSSRLLESVWRHIAKTGIHSLRLASTHGNPSAFFVAVLALSTQYSTPPRFSMDSLQLICALTRL